MILRQSVSGLFGVALACALVACGSSDKSSGADGSGGAPNGTGGAMASGAQGSGAQGAGGSGAQSTGAQGNGGSPALDDGLGAHPVDSTTATDGGTMTFTNVGAPGSWPRRLDRESGDPACDYKDGTDTWGGQCCQKLQSSASEMLAPFDEEMALVLKAIDIKQLAVYQPVSAELGSDWGLVSAFDDRDARSDNLWFTQTGDGSASFPGNLTTNDCVWYAMQEPPFECGDGKDYYCPDDPGIKHLGWSGSKLFVLLASMSLDDAQVAACSGDGAGHPGPWVALVASELLRDGARKWNGACNCYSKTGSVGDGCGEINLFEVVMDNNEYSNREFASTGVRSYQAGHVGGNVCGTGCDRNAFPETSEVVDACSKTAYESGPELEVGGATDGCPVWKRPEGDRYLVVLLDEVSRTIQVAVIHPKNVPGALESVLPNLPSQLGRGAIDQLVALRLPAAG